MKKQKRFHLFKFGLITLIIMILSASCGKDSEYIDISNSSENKLIAILEKNTNSDAIFGKDEIAWNKLEVYTTEKGYFMSVPALSKQGNDKGKLMFELIENTIYKKYLVYSLNAATVQRINNGLDFATHDVLNYLDERKKSIYSKASDFPNMGVQCAVCHSGILSGIELDEVVVTADTGGDPGFDDSDLPDWVNTDGPIIITDGNNNAEDQITNELTGKADCVYQKMVDSNNNINWILENFEDGNQPSQFNLKFVMSSTLGNETNASFATPFQSEIENTFVISINQNTLSDRTALGLARTILHEGIHARLWEFMYSRDKNLALIKNDFPGIYDYYREHKQNWDHEQMAEFYRETIAQGLKQFDNGQHSDTFYDALAWEGLAQYKDVNNNHELIYSEAWKKLTPSKQQEILNTITDEKQNGSKECN